MTALNPRRAPLFEALTAHAAAGHASFHVPGHKSGQALSAVGEVSEADRLSAPGAASDGEGDGDAALEREYYERLLRLDLTELSGLDDLHQAEGVIREAEELAADCFGAARTFFLVGGSTIGNLAMVLAVCGPGDVLLVQRNVHKSVLHGLMLARARAVFLPPRIDAVSGIACGVDPSDVRAALEKYPEARGLLVTNPNYYGMAADLRALTELVHAHGKPLLVDEAHGAHFGLHPELPPSALSCGADVVVQSTHKMLTAMTMGAMLHLGRQSGFARGAEGEDGEGTVGVSPTMGGADGAVASGAVAGAELSVNAVGSLVQGVVAVGSGAGMNAGEEAGIDANTNEGAGVRGRQVSAPGAALVDGDAIARLLAMLQSSSPSYPLLASLDLARRRVHTAAGRAQLARGLAAAQRVRRWLREQPCYGSLALPAGGPGAAPAAGSASTAPTGAYDALDPFKVTVWDTTGTLNGYALQRELERRGCFAELATPQHALLAFGPASTDADAARLCAALADISRQHRLPDRSRSGGPVPAPLPFPAAMRLSEPVSFGLTGSLAAPRERVGPNGVGPSAANHPAGTSAAGLPPSSVVEPLSRRVPLAAAVGLRAAAMVVPYPPGIPVLYPGELISPETAAYLQQLAEQGARFHGAPDGKLAELEVAD
jgi:arginine/lysine/ornithine decarboxylase